MRSRSHSKRYSIHLQLRMHILRDVFRTIKLRLPKLWRWNLCVCRIAKTRLGPATALVLDSIGEKAFVADGVHID